MNESWLFAVVGTASNKAELIYIWEQATPEGKAVIVILLLFSILAWSVMTSKAVQMRRARKLNQFFTTEFKTQKTVLDLFDRPIQADGCPLFMVYQSGSLELEARLKNPEGGRQRFVSLTGMEHVKRLMENGAPQDSLKLDSGLIPL